MGEKKRPFYVKAYQAWSIVLFIDPIAVPLIPLLAALKINPNLVTIVALLAGGASGFLFAIGYWSWGAIVFFISHFLDCIDGNIARFRAMTSAFGAKLDNWADYVRKP